jgi:putative ABC transport system substrate-binding protein
MASLAGTFLAAGASRAQRSSSRVTRIAILTSGTDRDRPIFLAFRKRLRELGYDSQDDQVTLYSATAGQPLDVVAQTVVSANPDVVLADGYLAAQAMAAKTRGIPIVAVMGDPVARGLAASLARPGGNITGVSTISDELIMKQIELTFQIVPAARRIGIVDPGIIDTRYRQFEDRAASIGVTLRRIFVRSLADANHELTPAALRDVEGLVFPPNAVFGSLSAPLARMVSAARKPAVYGDRDFVAVGGLVFYGIDIEAAFRRSAEIVDRVLKGANPAETPFEQPSRVELVINVRTAKALGIRIPQPLLLRADQVIE